MMKLHRLANSITSYAVLGMLLSTGAIFGQQEQSDTTHSWFYGTNEDIHSFMDSVFTQPEFDNALVGVYITSLKSGKTLYRMNPDKLFIPASNLKLFTTAAALHVLGPDFQFRTDIYTSGKMIGTTLKGDVVIRGYGDPAISGRFYEDDILAVLNQWADSLFEHGIDEISGNIIGDDSAFDDLGLGSGWAWDYESYWYSAPSGALSLNDNCIDITLRPGNIGSMAYLEYAPETQYVTVHNSVITMPSDSSTSIDVHRERGANIINVYGSIKRGSPPVTIYASINNPTQYLTVVFKEILEQRGIMVKGYAIDIDDLPEKVDYETTEILFSHYSVPLHELIKVINKSSQNFFAEQVLKTMAFQHEIIGTSHGGIEAASEYFSSIGIDTEKMIMVDGSGLSRLNLVTPAQTMMILQDMFNDEENFLHFFNSLPIAGIDGSLARRMSRKTTRNNVRGKTGYLGAVRTLSGYLFTGDKEPVAFVFFLNNFTVPLVYADQAQEAACRFLTNFKRSQK